MLDEPVMKRIAERIGCSLGQLCIAWALRNQVAVSTKTEREARMLENLRSSDFVDKLTKEDLDETLGCFYSELVQKNGKEYEPDCLRVMQGSLQRYLNDKNIQMDIDDVE